MRASWRWALALALALGCSQSRKPEQTEASSSGTSPQKGKPTDPEGERPSGPRPGGYVVLPSLDPVIVNPILQVTFDLATPLVYEGLLGLDSRLEPQPRLAERWKRSQDGRTLTFELRKDVKWHDGKEFSSDDVLFTIERIRDPQLHSGLSAYFSSVESVTAPNKFTVEVVYKEPYGPALAAWTFGIIPRHVFEGKDFVTAEANRAPVGTGPFRLARWAPKKSIVLAANETYWAGRPYLDQIELVLDVASTEELNKMTLGSLDFAEVGPDDWSGVAQTPEFRDKYETGTVDETRFNLIAWNCRRKPFTDKRVRQALAMSLDRSRVIEDVLEGSARPLSAPFPVAMWGADPDVGPQPFDLARAAALLDEAGVTAQKGGNRMKLEFIVLDARRGPVLDEMTAIFRNDLGSIGVDLSVTYLPADEFVVRLEKHDFDAAFYAWVPDIADPDPYVLLHSSQADHGVNYPGWKNADADRLLEEGRRATERAERKKAYFALHRLVADEQPYTFLYAPQTHFAWNRRVHAVNPIDVADLPRFPGVAKWWVEE